MSSRKSRSKRKDRARGDSGKPAFDTGPIRFTAIAALLIVSAAATALGVVVGVRGLESRAAELVRIDEPKVEFAWPRLANDRSDPRARAEPPRTWLAEQFQRELTETAIRALAQQDDAFAAHGLELAGRMLDRTGWFAAPPRLRRDADGVVRVSGQWRTPWAVVRTSSGDHLISHDGFLMPVVYEHGKSGLPVFQNVNAAPPVAADGTPAFGTAWPGEDLAAALELMAVLKSHGAWPQVAGFDLIDFGKGRKIAIVTDTDARVVWGAPPERWSPDEVPTRTKLARLDALLGEYGRIDAGLRRLEIFGPNVIVDRSP